MYSNHVGMHPYYMYIYIYAFFFFFPVMYIYIYICTYYVISIHRRAYMLISGGARASNPVFAQLPQRAQAPAEDLVAEAATQQVWWGNA